MAIDDYIVPAEGVQASRFYKDENGQILRNVRLWTKGADWKGPPSMEIVLPGTLWLEPSLEPEMIVLKEPAF